MFAQWVDDVTVAVDVLILGWLAAALFAPFAFFFAARNRRLLFFLGCTALTITVAIIVAGIALGSSTIELFSPRDLVVIVVLCGPALLLCAVALWIGRAHVFGVGHSHSHVCHQCGYDLTGLHGPICPHCGAPANLDAPQDGSRKG